MDAVLRLAAKRSNWWESVEPPRYHTYAPTTREYLESGDCDPSQLEPGVWLWPGSSTDIEPPNVPAGHAAVLREDGGNPFWAVVRDRRGEVVYVDGGFQSITTLGEHLDLQLVVHDAQYALPDTDEDAARIRMWVNADVIEFEDSPSILARQVLARWEAHGETIRPVDVDIETVAERDARLDAAAAAMVEGTETEEPDHA